MMECLIYQILSEWFCSENERSQLLRRHPEYTSASNTLFQFSDALRNSMSPDVDEAFKDYEAARNRMAALAEDSAFLTGVQAGIRLMFRLL